MLEEVTPKIPETWQHIPPKKIQLAIKFGLVKLGYTLEDYLVEAVETGGYETAEIWAVQGSGKSSRMLQMAYWIYKDWDVVLEHIVFKPSKFVKTLRQIPMGKRIPLLLWDDINVHYTSSTFKTDIKQYEAIDATWAAIRTKCNIILMSSPLIDRLAKNIKDNLTFEVFMGRNQMELINRLFRLPGLETIESNFFKVTVEEPSRFNLFDVPKDIFERYWYEMRLPLTEEALEKLDKTVTKEDMEGYITVFDVAKELHKSPNTVQQMISRGVIQGSKIGGILCMSIEDFEEYRKLEIGRTKQKHIT